MADTGSIQLVHSESKCGTHCQQPWKRILVCYAISLVLLAAIGLILAFVIPSSRARAIIYTGCDEVSGKRMGSLELEAENGMTRLRCQLSGLPFGLHGLHVHESANFTDGCTSTLGHYNPTESNHGGPLGEVRHDADFGNIMGNFKQTCETEVLANVRLEYIVGRAFVVHMEGDDLGQGGDVGSRTTGNAGGRLAGGRIEWV